MTTSDFISPQRPPGSERRRAARYPCRLDGPFRLVIARRDECWWARARDISTTGISFLVRARLEPGTLTFLRLQGNQVPTPLAVRAEVVHATAQDDGNWLVGCQLQAIQGELSDAERLHIQDLFRHGGEKPAQATDQGDIPETLAEKLYYPFALIF